jgi:tRNA A-37 threonylcarbamoyl transferase component Bud32
MDMLIQITTKIIREQALIIGPIAWEEAQQIEGLTVDIQTQEISFTVTGESQGEVVDKLVKRYEQLFGRASLEVCRDAVKDLIADVPADQVPTLLRP